MTSAAAHNINLRNTAKGGKIGLIIGAALAAIGLIPVAVAAAGILRGGVEPYMVLAALILG